MPNIKGDQLNTGTNADQIVQLDGSGRLPAVDGSQLTGVSGGGGSPILTELFDDKSPQLGGDLDTNSFNIVTADVTTGTADTLGIYGGDNSYVGGGNYAGSITMSAGNGTNNNYGGYLGMYGGSSDSYLGGFVNLFGGNSTTGTGGNLNLGAGSASTSGTPGNVNIGGGDAGLTDNGGHVFIAGGRGGGIGNTGGDVVLRPGKKIV